jgi:hypothetical protein
MPDTNTQRQSLITTQHQSLTVGQIHQARQRISQLAEQAKEITALLLSAYGAEDRRTFRAQEIGDAIQRLQWAMDRAEPVTA